MFNLNLPPSSRCSNTLSLNPKFPDETNNAFRELRSQSLPKYSLEILKPHGDMNYCLKMATPNADTNYVIEMIH